MYRFLLLVKITEFIKMLYISTHEVTDYKFFLAAAAAAAVQ